MHIHFVCSGNAYRSRLAEAYFKSKLEDRRIVVSSSGISAGTQESRMGNGPICWYAMRIMKRESLIPFMSWRERQTTKEVLKDVDLLICMGEKHLRYCQDQLGFTGKSLEVWNIPDLNEMEGFIPSTEKNRETDVNHIKLTEQTFAVIVQKVDDLIKRVKTTQF